MAAPIQISPQQMQAYEHADEGTRVRILIRLAKSGEPDIAEMLLHKYPLQGPLAANRQLFVEGLIMEDRRDLTGAARVFRKALADDPKLTLVRSELAAVLVQLDENDSAKHHLQLLVADAPDQSDASNIRSFIEKIDESHPYSFGGYVSVAPSTNINNGSNHNTVWSALTNSDWTISSANQKQSGLGISAGLNGGYAKRLGNNWQGVVAANISTDLYGDFNFDSISTSESAEMRYLLEKGFVSAGGVFSQGIDPAHRTFTYNSWGPRLAVNYQIDQRNLFKGSIIDEYRNYINSPALNGWVLTGDVSLTHAIDSTMNYTSFLGYQRVNAEMPNLAYQSYYGGVNFYKELSQGITLDLTAQARIANFDAPYVLAGAIRADQKYSASATLTKRDLNMLGFAPSITYTYTLNKSNIALYDFDSHTVNLNLTKDF